MICGPALRGCSTIITDVSAEYEHVLLDGSGLAMGTGRSPGLHLSHVIRDMDTMLSGKYLSPNITPENVGYLEMGFLWEELLEWCLKQRQGRSRKVVRPGEISKDGIFMTIDGLDSTNPAYDVVEEYKLTYRGLGRLYSHTSQEYRTWWWQIKAYCHGYGTRYARLIAFYVNGSYRPSKPRFVAWELEFSQEELEDNWRMILQHAQSMPPREEN